MGRLEVGGVSGGKGNMVGLLGCICWLDRGGIEVWVGLGFVRAE